jgi:hypothetical protein
MSITVKVIGHGPIPHTDLAQCAVGVTFDGPIETLTLTVVVPTKPEASIEARAIARAKELVRLFVATALA